MRRTAPGLHSLHLLTRTTVTIAGTSSSSATGHPPTNSICTKCSQGTSSSCLVTLAPSPFGLFYDPYTPVRFSSTSCATLSYPWTPESEGSTTSTSVPVWTDSSEACLYFHRNRIRQRCVAGSRSYTYEMTSTKIRLGTCCRGQARADRGTASQR